MRTEGILWKCQTILRCSLMTKWTHWFILLSRCDLYIFLPKDSTQNDQKSEFIPSLQRTCSVQSFPHEFSYVMEGLMCCWIAILQWETDLSLMLSFSICTNVILMYWAWWEFTKRPTNGTGLSMPMELLCDWKEKNTHHPVLLYTCGSMVLNLRENICSFQHATLFAVLRYKQIISSPVFVL